MVPLKYIVPLKLMMLNCIHLLSMKAPIFFTTNHHNYARWMAYYALELSNLHNDKPEVFELLQKGAFSMNRSGKPFSGVGVDMALEQTINAEAKSCLRGIIPYADVSTAVNRWIVTGAMRSQIVNHLLEMADLKNYHADNKELTKPRMKEIRRT